MPDIFLYVMLQQDPQFYGAINQYNVINPLSDAQTLT